MMSSLFTYRNIIAAASGFFAFLLLDASSRAFNRDELLVAPNEARRNPIIVPSDDILEELDPEMDAPTPAREANRPAIGARAEWTMSGKTTRAQQAMIASGVWSAAIVIARDGDDLESYEALETAAMFVQRLEAAFGRCSAAARGGVVRLACAKANAVLEPWSAEHPTALRVAAFSTPAWTFADGRMTTRSGHSAGAPSPIVYLRGLSAARFANRP